MTDSVISAVLIDIDGVLADFITPSLEVASIPLQSDQQVSHWDYFLPYMSEAEFMRRIDAVESFWANLIPYAWAAELVQLCESVAQVYFCSNPAGYRGAADAKLEWLIQHGFMDRGARNYILTPHKWLQAAPGRVLIDDSPCNIACFMQHKGVGVLFPQPWNSPAGTITHASRMQYISECLATAVNELSSDRVYGKDSEELESILAEAERLTGVERQADYGPPDKDFIRISGMWTAMLSHKLKEGVKFESWEVAQMMICVKLSRLQHSRKRDSVVDAAGYANCMDYCYRAAGGY